MIQGITNLTLQVDQLSNQTNHLPDGDTRVLGGKDCILCNFVLSYYTIKQLTVDIAVKTSAI